MTSSRTTTPSSDTGNAPFLRSISSLRASHRAIVNASDDVYTVEQMADMLGLSKWAILKRIERGQLRAHKQGKYWYILKSEFVAGLRQTEHSVHNK